MLCRNVIESFWFQDKRGLETCTVEFVETKEITVVQSFFSWLVIDIGDYVYAEYRSVEDKHTYIKSYTYLHLLCILHFFEVLHKVTKLLYLENKSIQDIQYFK